MHRERQQRRFHWVLCPFYNYVFRYRAVLLTRTLDEMLETIIRIFITFICIFIVLEYERSQNTVLLASTQAVYKAPHSTVRRSLARSFIQESESDADSQSRDRHLGGSSSSSRKSQSVRLEHNTLEPVAASCTYASAINASKRYPVYSLCTDVRPSQDHRILRMQSVRINLA